MISLRRSIICGLRGLHRDCCGAALTEFAITLPVYMIFMVGIITLWEIQEGAVTNEKEASAELWEDAIKIQSQYTEHINPTAGAIDSIHNHYGWSSLGSFDFSSETAFAAIDGGSSAGGIYFESAAKVAAFDAVGLAEGTPDELAYSMDPKLADGDSMTNRLLNDQMNFSNSDFGSLAGMLEAVLDFTGSRLGAGAGIRYGIASGISENSTSIIDEKRNYQVEYESKFNATAPTMPEERLAALAMSYIRVSSNDGFANTAAWGLTNIGSGPGSIDDVDDLTGDAQECMDAAEDYQECVQAGIDSGMPNSMLEDYAEDCEDHYMPDDCDVGGGSGEMGDIADCAGDLDWSDIGEDGDDPC